MIALIPKGKFEMGNDEGDDEKPVHTVYVDAFCMDIYQVTNAEYWQFVEATGYHNKPRYWDDNEFNQPNQPVVGMTWHDAMAYAQWAGKRLPTEAEWEKAARGGLVGKRFPWGDGEANQEMANYNNNIGGTTAVGSYPLNGYGLYDMAGNVWEWCLDEYQEDFYQASPQENPVAGGKLPELLANYKNIETCRVLRGGSWGSNPYFMRAASRHRYGPVLRDYGVGFRCVQDVPL